jgi:hypothetical protein
MRRRAASTPIVEASKPEHRIDFAYSADCARRQDGVCLDFRRIGIEPIEVAGWGRHAAEMDGWPAQGAGGATLMVCSSSCGGSTPAQDRHCDALGQNLGQAGEAEVLIVVALVFQATPRGAPVDPTPSGRKRGRPGRTAAPSPSDIRRPKEL